MYKVFISRKSSDAEMAKNLYAFLTAHGLTVFDSDHSLQEIGQANYNAIINDTLDFAEHLIVIASKKEYLTSPWVKSEWETFENEYRSGRKKGNLLVVLKSGIRISDLPLALRQKQVFYYNPSDFNKILPYLGHEYTAEEIDPVPPKHKTELHIKVSLFVVFLSIGIYALFSIFLKQEVKSTVEDKYFNSDSLFIQTKYQFLEEGLSKEIALQNFKKIVEHDPNLIDKAVEVFEEKAERVPFLADKYYSLSEHLLNHLDSIRNGN